MSFTLDIHHKAQEAVLDILKMLPQLLQHIWHFDRVLKQCDDRKDIAINRHYFLKQSTTQVISKRFQAL